MLKRDTEAFCQESIGHFYLGKYIYRSTVVYVYETIEFSLNLFSEFAEFSDRIIAKKLFETAGYCARDQNV